MCFHQCASHGRGFDQNRFQQGRGGFGPGFGRFAHKFAAWRDEPRVNLREKKDWYELFVFAPGLTKDAFEISVADDVLSVRFKNADAASDDSAAWIYREHAGGSFERRFALGGKVDSARISARYADGVLEITLPKNPSAAAQEVPIA